MQQVFDTYARSYDAHFTDSLIGKAQRRQVYKKVLNHANLNVTSVLEINCGTGEDAWWLTRQGAKVLATDISEGMIAVAKNKPANKVVDFKQFSAQDISSLSPNRYNLIFSNFGGLNCLSLAGFEKFKNGCVKLQTQKDQVVLVIMGTKCLWERIYFRFTKNKENTNRRANANGTETIIDGNHFKTWYYSPKQLKTLFRADYRHINTKPVGLFVPPSYLEPYFKNRKRWFGILKFLDTIFGNLSFLSNYADHYVIVFEKK